MTNTVSPEAFSDSIADLHPAPAYRILLRFPKQRRHVIVKLAGDHVGEPWGKHRNMLRVPSGG